MYRHLSVFHAVLNQPHRTRAAPRSREKPGAPGTEAYPRRVDALDLERPYSYNEAMEHDSFFGIVKAYQGVTPTVGESVFVAPGAVVIGNVTLGQGVGIWYNSVARGDVNTIEIGEYTNIQDGSVLHTGYGPEHALHIGARVTVGHKACVHGCTIEDECLIGIGSTVLNGAIIHSHTYVAAGALVPPGMEVPEGVLVGGVPAKIIRDLRQKELDDLVPSSKRYYRYAQEHIAMLRNTSA